MGNYSVNAEYYIERFVQTAETSLKPLMAKRTDDMINRTELAANGVALWNKFCARVNEDFAAWENKKYGWTEDDTIPPQVLESLREIDQLNNQLYELLSEDAWRDDIDAFAALSKAIFSWANTFLSLA